MVQGPRSGAPRTGVWAVLLLLVVGIYLHREVILHGAVYHMDDAADGYYPGHIAVARAFAHGELPTWEPGSWSGWPLIVDPYNGVFYPLNAVYYAVGAARGLGFAVLMHIVLGGAGMWWLLRRRKLGFGAALFGALAFALSTFFVVRIRHVIFIQMMGWLPWILVGVEGWMATRRRRELLLVAGSTALALVAGALSIGHFAALAVGAYTLARIVSDIPEHGIAPTAATRRRQIGRDLLALGGAALVGALCAAAQLVPTVAHLPYSPRSLGSDYAFASSYAWPTLHYLTTLLAPDYYGGEDRFHYLGAPNHWELCGWYVGVLCVGAAPAVLWPWWKKGKPILPGRRAPQVPKNTNQEVGPQRRGGELYTLAALVLLAIALALGDAAPVHPFFFKYVPLYAAIRCPARALLMAVLALPILGAHGVSTLLALRLPLRRWVGLVAAASIALFGAWLSRRYALRAPALAEQFKLEALALAHLIWVVAAGVAVLALGVVRVVPARVAALGLAAVLAVDLVGVDRAYLVPQPADYPSGMERFAAIEWIRTHNDGGDRFLNDPGGPFRLHNVGMVLDMENVSGYDSVAIWRYVNLLHLLNKGFLYPEKKLKHDFAGIGLSNLSARMLDLMNVRWLVAASAPSEPAPSGGPRWVERFHPTSPTGAPAAKYEASWDAKLRVFENTTVLPRAFVTYRADVIADDPSLAARLLDPAFDPGAVALLEVAPGSPVAPSSVGAPPAYTPARFVEKRRHRLVLDIDAAAPGILIVSDTHYPGWTATVDGRPAPLLRADWAFRGVAVAAGHHRVTMDYTSRPTQLGIALSLAGLLALVALGTLGRRRAASTTPDL